MADQPEYRVRGGGPHPHLKVGCTPEQLARLVMLARERLAKLAAEQAAADQQAAQTPLEAP